MNVWGEVGRGVTGVIGPSPSVSNLAQTRCSDGLGGALLSALTLFYYCVMYTAMSNLAQTRCSDGLGGALLSALTLFYYV
ncbi:hypothetical protein J6590_003206 [Homalodisca vitripennis]|nr:hypothetical protein J6590_003206 [Homalodisca vitripennis]